MRQEDHLARARIVIHAVVVAVHHVAVPVPRHDLQRAVSGETIHVQHLAQLLKAHQRLGHLRRARQRLQVRPVAHLALAVLVALQLLRDFAEETAVVEIAIGVLEVHGEEVLRESLLHHVEAARAPVQFQRGVGDARRRHARVAIQLAADVLAEVAAVLHRVVQVNFLQPVKALVGDELVKTQRQRRLVIDVAPAARRAFHMQPHVAPDLRVLPHRGPHVLAIIAAQAREFVRGNFNAQGKDGFVVEDFRTRHTLRRVTGGKRGGDQPAKQEPEETTHSELMLEPSCFHVRLFRACAMTPQPGILSRYLPRVDRL